MRIAVIRQTGTVYRDATAEEADMQYTLIENPDVEATQLDRIEAQVLYTALITDTLLEA